MKAIRITKNVLKYDFHEARMPRSTKHPCNKNWLNVKILSYVKIPIFVFQFIEG